MGQQEPCDDDSRDDLRKSLRLRILGELRLAKRSQNEILDVCRDVYIGEICPKSERVSFFSFVDAELERCVARVASERLTWPDETDCDRLDRVETALREQGVLLWQASPCCNSCTAGEMGDRIEVVNHRFPGFRDRLRGYAFFIDQNMPEELARSSELSVYLIATAGSRPTENSLRRNCMSAMRSQLPARFANVYGPKDLSPIGMDAFRARFASC